MTSTVLAAAAQASVPAKPSRLQQLANDEQGSTAVEFAIISVPFVTMLLGIMSVCLYFFTTLQYENAVFQGSRDLRVGTYQQQLVGSSYFGKTGDALKTEFKKNICARVSDNATCMARIRIMVQSRTAFGGLTEPNCKDASGAMIDDTTANTNFNPGGASEFLLVTGCYSWEFGGKLPFFNIGNLSDGSFLVQSSYAFRTEPFN
jgi:Flp pilus assembly protein TadG